MTDDLESLRPQHHVRWVNGHLYAWDVTRLLRDAPELPVIQLPLSEIAEIDEPYWYAATGDTPTCRSVLAHVRQAEKADLSYPILLCADGRIMDGMHRVMKALSLGHETVAARRLERTPPPDHVDVSLDDLGYD